MASLKLHIKKFGLQECIKQYIYPPWHDTGSTAHTVLCLTNISTVYSPFFTPGSCIIIVILYCITQLVLWSQPCLRSNWLDKPVHCNEAGWKLPAPVVSCISAVPCDIHLLSLVWLVNLSWRETLPLLITSAQRAAFNSMNGHGKLCLCHHKPDTSFKSLRTTSPTISHTGISICL